jgi:hypothetical protein
MLIVSIAAVGVLAAIHILVPRMRFLHVVPRSRWLSAAGGAAVAYVFLHVLPELASHQRAVAAALGEAVFRADQVVYAIALAGLVVFYGLERMIHSPDDRGREQAYRVHLAAFALYNVLIGYMIFHREQPGLLSLVLFTTAMGLHFVTTDHGLWVDHKERYGRWGWPLLVAALAAGATLGALTTVPEWGVAFLFALLAGGVLLNVLKEELPAERQSRFGAFLAGAGVYGGLLWVA